MLQGGDLSFLYPLTAGRHAGFNWLPDAGRRAVDMRELPLGLEEISFVAVRAPLVIRVGARRPEPVIPSAELSGGAEAVNLVFDRHPASRPWCLRQGPFRVVRSARGRIVMVDERRLCLDGKGTPLFDREGAMTPETRAHLGKLAAWQDDIAAAHKAARALAEAQVLVAWGAKGDEWAIPDPVKVASLDGRAAARLHKVGALRLAHLSAASLRTLGTAPASQGPDMQTPTRAPLGRDFLSALRKEVL